MTLTIAQIFPAQYPQELHEKQQRIEALLKPFSAPNIEVFASPVSYYRMRAEFRIWHQGSDIFYAMQNPVAPTQPIFLEQFPVGGLRINALMTELMAALRLDGRLRKKLFQVEFLTATTGEALVTLIYHRKLDATWQELASKLEKQISAAVIGRSKGQKIVISRDYVTEAFCVDGTVFSQRQPESAFSQPNAFVNQQMLNWANACCKKVSGDLLELYCGNGNFTLPLSKQFAKVLATEVSKTSVAAALHNLAENSCSNVALVRLSSEEITGALQGVRLFRRLAAIDLSAYHFSTVLVDPPRAGLDAATLALVAGFDHIIYISCNTQTLQDNLLALTQTHAIKEAALFDQFPYTSHIESGVFLTRKD